jgi:cation diffusion facilitator CzcD-associated flavoprotein CzcO
MPDSYPRVPSGEELQAYFENYAKDFDIFDKIRFNSATNQLKQLGDGRWQVDFTDLITAKKDRKQYDFIVVASGLYFEPYLPEFPKQKQFSGDIIHTSAYRSPSQVTGKNVAIVGFGKSALDVAGETAKFAKSTTLIYRQPHWPIPMDILDFLDVRRIYLTRLACAFLPPYQRPGQLAKFLHRFTPWLLKGFWRLTETIIKLQYPLTATGTEPEAAFETDIFNLDFLPRKQVYQLMKQGKIKNQRAEIKAYTGKGLHLSNGENIDCDIVIYGTGYRADTSYLPKAFKDSQDNDGTYLYRHILHPELDNLAFIGRAATFSNCLTAHLASFWLVNLLKGRINLPEKADMASEIEAMKQWKRSFMPPLSSRSTVVKLHMTHYHDELLKDAGINPKRKKNFVAEWCQDYRPRDYRAIFTTA